ncbi:MAG: methyltransferase [Planctomycetota bacterium]|jgi:hypothetical protein
MTHQTSELPLPAQMLQFINGYWVSKLVYVAARLSLADHLQEGPCSAEGLAQKVGADPQRLKRCMRALASLGIFSQGEDGRFESTALSETLRSDRPDSMRDFALMMVESYNWLAWDKLLDGVVKGGIPFDDVHGKAAFEYLSENPDEEATFARSMASLSSIENPAVADAYDFSAHRMLVDVGGSRGHLLSVVLGHHRAVKGTLFDQPQVVEQAQSSGFWTQGGLAERTTFTGGNFFESVPEGADAYMMKYILHDWDDEKCVRILSNCREAMAPGGRVLVIDSVINPGNQPEWGKLMDINMLVVAGGQERTEAEFGELFSRAGLRLERVIATACPLSIVVAERSD